jgi:uncharacterized protein (TIGR03437 family)
VTCSVAAAFSTGEAPVPLVSLKDGRWSGTWQVRNAQQVSTTVTVAAESPERGISGVARITGGVRGAAPPPQLAAGGVLNGASLRGDAPLAPGGIVALFGSRLADATLPASSLPLQTQLAGVRISVGGQPMPLFFASDGQVNGLLPFELAPNTRHQLVVRRGSSLSVPEPIVVSEATPAVFTRDQSGRGQGIILDGGGRLAEPGNPAAAGDVVVIFCAGLGAVQPPVPAGQPAPANPLARVAAPVEVRFGDIAGNVLFAGLTPGFTGLYQINVQIPPGVPPGDAVPVVVTVAGSVGPPVSVALR